MPVYKGVEVWIEDSECRKLNHRDVTIDLRDDRTVTAKIEMLKDEAYTIRCLSPTSVFCDVFVITASKARKRAARFHLDKSLAITENASGSSAAHTEGPFRDQGLRTPKRQFQQGKLGSVEVEIRRISKIVKGEPSEDYEADGGEEAVMEFIMTDDFAHPPWIAFHFDINSISTAENIRRRGPHRMVKDRSEDTRKGSSNASREAPYECLGSSRKRPREHDGCDSSAGVGENPTDINSDRLQQEYRREVAEEQRLLQILQERLRAKKARNMELRRLLGERP